METHRDSVSCDICGVKNLSLKLFTDNALFADSLNKFIKQLGLPEHDSTSQVRLCDECCPCMEKAVAWREELNDVERDVRSLQRIILKMMHKLKALQGNYLNEMKALEWKIQKFQERSADGIGRLAMQEKKQKDDMRHGKGHVGDTLKQGILDVVNELGTFHQVCLPATEQIKDKFSIASLGNYTQNQDPTATENFDIEYVVYSESLSKREPIVVDENEGNLGHVDMAVPENIASPTSPSSSYSSSSTDSQRRGTKKTCKSKGKAGRSAPCKHCGKTFADKWKLRRHVYTLTGERPYMCHMCPAAFGERSSLKRHLVGHSGEKPFICPQCKKGFSSKDLLERHIRRHSGEKKFSCSVCGKKFTARESVKRHYKSEHSSD